MTTMPPGSLKVRATTSCVSQVGNKSHVFCLFKIVKQVLVWQLMEWKCNYVADLTLTDEAEFVRQYECLNKLREKSGSLVQATNEMLNFPPSPTRSFRISLSLSLVVVVFP